MKIEAGTRSIKEVPKDFAARVTRAGGTNRFGGPNYRVVWGWSRMGWIGTDADHVWREPKYLDGDKWILEKWMPPEHYGRPQDWTRTFGALGPFPAYGEYEMVTDFDPIELTSKVAEYLIQVILASRRGSSRDRGEAIKGRLDASENEWSRETDDMLDDAMPAYHGATNVALSS